MSIKGLGIDSTTISRFRALLRTGKDRFVENTFTEVERTYCFSFKDPAPHFAGTFAAKEAIRKATGNVQLPMNAVEIRREKTGKPHVWVQGRRSRSILVSITHEGAFASAVAIHQAV